MNVTVCFVCLIIDMTSFTRRVIMQTFIYTSYIYMKFPIRYKILLSIHSGFVYEHTNLAFVQFRI